MTDPQLQVAKELTLAVFEKFGTTGKFRDEKNEFLTSEMCRVFENICETVKKVTES